MKKIASMCLAIYCACLPVASLAALITSLDDIQNWTGSGSNRAGIVIQWNDGGSPTSLAWGYRWNGSASGYDMLTAIAGSWRVLDNSDPSIQYGSGSGSDSRLTLDIHDFGWGRATYSISFNEFGVTRTRADWGSGYWEYFNVGGTFDTPPSGDPNTFLGTDSYPGTVPNSNWISSWSGFETRVLSDGSWDGWSFAPGFASQAIVQPHDVDNYSAAVPEPNQIAATFLTLVAMAGFIFKNQAAKKMFSRRNA